VAQKEVTWVTVMVLPVSMRAVKVQMAAKTGISGLNARLIVCK